MAARQRAMAARQRVKEGVSNLFPRVTRLVYQTGHGILAIVKCPEPANNVRKE